VATKSKDTVETLTTGRMTARVETKITAGLDEAITDVAKELAGGGSARMFRSRAVRELLVEGVKARRARRAGRVTRAADRAR
jgi:hypothetical protein